MLLSWYPPQESVGNGIFMLRQASALQQACLRAGREASVEVMSVQPQSWMGRDLRILGKGMRDPDGAVVLTHWVRTYRDKGSLPVKVWRQALAWWTLWRGYLNLHGEPPTVVIAQVAWKAAVVGAWLGLPMAVLEHWSGWLQEAPPYRWWERVLVKRALFRAGAVGAVSPWLAKAMETHLGGLRVSVLPNVVRAPFWPDQGGWTRRPPASFAEGGTVNYLLHLSDMSEVKNPGLLLQAWQESSLHSMGYELRIGGEYPPDLPSRHASVPGLRWLGPLDTAALKDVLNRAWVLLVPSKHETFSLLTAEALLSGCPVWALYPPLMECYGKIKGFRVLPDDRVATWAEAMRNLASEDPPVAGEGASEALLPYRPDAAGDRLLSWVQSLLDQSW